MTESTTKSVSKALRNWHEVLRAHTTDAEPADVTLYGRERKQLSELRAVLSGWLT